MGKNDPAVIYANILSLCVTRMRNESRTFVQHYKTHRMKVHFILSAVLLLSSAAAVQAQTSDTDTRQRLVFGVKAGTNFSNVWDEEGDDFAADGKFGFAGGVYFGIPAGTFIGFQPEILLSQKGFQASGTIGGTPYEVKRTTTYLDFPLQLQIKPAAFLTILAGPQYSFLLQERNEYTFGANSSVHQEDFNNDNIRKNILGFATGADINISHVVVSTRFGWDFLSNHGDGSSSTPRYKNRWIQFTLGFKI